MRDYGVNARNTRAVVREFTEAVEDGQFELACRIIHANPPMAEQLEALYADLTARRAGRA